MTEQGRGVVVVTGASAGIGEHTAETLALAGRRVIAVARRADRLAELAARHDGAVRPMVADIRDHDSLAGELAALPEEWRDIDTLVNNAGLSKGFGPAQTGDRLLWREMVDTNIIGLLNAIALILPGLVARGGGHVVNVGSIAATYPYLGGNVYGATKAFVHQLSSNLRVDLHGTGVRVSCVAPGMARTEFALVRYDGDQDKAEQLYQGITPLSAQDVARTVAWCLDQPATVNVGMVEVMSADQPFGLALTAPGPMADGGQSR